MEKKLFLIVYLVCSAFCLKAQNVSLIKDLTPGSASTFVELEDDIIGHIGDKVLFVVYDASSIGHLYASDGTEPGTVQLLGLTSSTEKFQSIVKVNASTIAFVVFDSDDYTFLLYITDGSTVTLLDKHLPALSIENLKVHLGGLTYSSDNYTLHTIDLLNTSDVVVLTAPRPFIDYYMEGTKIYYGLRHALGDTLFVRDVLLSTTTKLGYIGQLNTSTLNFNKVGSKLFLFSLLPSDHRGFYVTDGQTDVSLVKTFHVDGESNRQFALMGDKLFFNAVLPIDDPDFNGYELWVSDGTSSGTLPLSHASIPLYFLNYGTLHDGLFYYMSSEGDLSNGLHLYATDGTVAGTSLLFDDLLSPHVFFSRLISSNGKLYAAGYDVRDGMYGNEIWDITGSSPVLYETKPGLSAVYASKFYATDSKFFFIGNESATGYELYLFDPQTPTIITSNASSQSNGDLFSYYPNPAGEQLTVEYKGTDQITGMRLRDMSGKTVRTYENESLLNMNGLQSGIYFLEVELKNSKQVLKINK